MIIPGDVVFSLRHNGLVRTDRHFPRKGEDGARFYVIRPYGCGSYTAQATVHEDWLITKEEARERGLLKDGLDQDTLDWLERIRGLNRKARQNP